MDNLTHTLSGLVLARLSKKSDESDPLSLKTRMIVATLATNMPDLDIVLAPFSSQFYLLHHRGETHSLLMLPLWAWLLSWLFGKAFRHPGGWQPFYMLVALSLLIHILRITVSRSASRSSSIRFWPACSCSVRPCPPCSSPAVCPGCCTRAG
jgi:inner membrane protein